MARYERTQIVTTHRDSLSLSMKPQLLALDAMDTQHADLCDAEVKIALASPDVPPQPALMLPVMHDANTFATFVSDCGNAILKKLANDSPIRGDFLVLIDAARCIKQKIAEVDLSNKLDQSKIEPLLASLGAPSSSDIVPMQIAALKSALTVADMLAGGELRIEVSRQPPNIMLVLTGFPMTVEALRQALEAPSMARRADDSMGQDAASIRLYLSQAGSKWRVTEAAALEILVPIPCAAAVVPERTALVVDDQPWIRRLVRRTLTSIGFAVDESSSGEEAISLLERPALTLVVTDIEMNMITGGDLAEYVRKHTPSTRILFISGDSDWQCGKLPAGTAFLEKPFGPMELQKAVSELLT